MTDGEWRCEHAKMEIHDTHRSNGARIMDYHDPSRSLPHLNRELERCVSCLNNWNTEDTTLLGWILAFTRSTRFVVHVSLNIRK
jgi:hypothetical protein